MVVFSNKKNVFHFKISLFYSIFNLYFLIENNIKKSISIASEYFFSDEKLENIFKLVVFNLLS